MNQKILLSFMVGSLCSQVSLAVTLCDRALQGPMTRATQQELHQFTSVASGVAERKVLDWTQSNQCISCHTALPLALGKVSRGEATNSEALSNLKIFMQDRFQDFSNATAWYSESEEKIRQSKTAEAAVSFFLTVRLEEFELSEKIAKSLKKLQRADGGFDWLDFDLKPWEDKDGEYFGAALIASGISKSKRTAMKNEAWVKNLKKYVLTSLANENIDLYHQASLLWAAQSLDIGETAETKRIVKKLIEKQRADGGWSMNDLGNWSKRGSAQQTKGSDGQSTAYLMYVLKQVRAARSTSAATQTELKSAYKSGLNWMLKNKKADGTWVSNSVNIDSDRNHSFASDIATGFGMAVLNEH